MTLRTLRHLGLVLIPLSLCSAASAEFIRPGKPTDPLVYGVKNGIMVAIHPFGLDGRDKGGPRGLIRVGYQDGKFYLLNFIAVEPLVGSAKGFSELEKGSDEHPGKRFWVGDSVKDGGVAKNGKLAGRIEETPAGRVLSFVLHVEPFANGARPVVEVSLFEKLPNRVRFRTFSGSGGKNMRQCILTATMGNQSRCRFLWLRTGAVFAPRLYADYTGTGFVEKEPYRLSNLQRTAAGDMVAAISPDEFEPREVWPLPTAGWHHNGPWMAQFWLKPRGSFDQSLHCRVNGRRVYWGGEVPLPGGIAYENFEFREDYRPGQEVWFGYMRGSPARAFGFDYDASPRPIPRRKVSRAYEEEAAEAARLARPLTNGNFTAGLDGWHAERGGRSFVTFTQGTQTVLTTFGKNKDADTGRLSQSFVIPADATELQFALHGGADVHNLYVALWHADRLYRKMTGRNDNTPFRVRWDVKPLRGELVTLEIVDDSTAEWGFIGVQQFALVKKE